MRRAVPPIRLRRLLAALAQGITLCALVWAQADCLAQSQRAPAWLETCESSLFRRTYGDEAMNTRLSRLERQTFGDAAPAGLSLEARQKRLHWALRHLLAPTASSPVSTAPVSKPQKTAPAVADAGEYPSVTSLEQALFQQSFEAEDIFLRLARLERRAFNLTFQQLPLADRVDQLTRKTPQALFGAAAAPSAQVAPRRSQPSQVELDYLQSVSRAEEIVLGHDNPQGLLSERLEAIEWRLFGRPYEGESPDTRFSRIQARLGAAALTPARFAPPPYNTPPDASSDAPSGTWTATPQEEVVTSQWTVPGGQTVTQTSQTLLQTPYVTQRGVRRRQMSVSGPGTVIYTETRTRPLPEAGPNFRLFRRRPSGSDPSYFAPIPGSPERLQGELPSLRGPINIAALSAPSRTSVSSRVSSPGSPPVVSSDTPVTAAKAPRAAKPFKPLSTKPLKASRTFKKYAPEAVTPAPPPDPRTLEVLREYAALSAPLQPLLTFQNDSSRTTALDAPFQSPFAPRPQATGRPSWSRQLDRLERQATGGVRQDLPVEGRLNLLESRLLGETFDTFSPPARVFNLQRRYFRNPLSRLASSLRATRDTQDNELAEDVAPLGDLPPLATLEARSRRR
ncbi:MAG: hypothetical protein IPK79_08400 [Vampirovibrionales bacterium]|nr:hypothetical protein [Vampirovibrionales bacterium]